MPTAHAARPNARLPSTHQESFPLLPSSLRSSLRPLLPFSHLRAGRARHLASRLEGPSLREDGGAKAIAIADPLHQPFVGDDLPLLLLLAYNTFGGRTAETNRWWHRHARLTGNRLAPHEAALSPTAR